MVRWAICVMYLFSETAIVSPSRRLTCIIYGPYPIWPPSLPGATNAHTATAAPPAQEPIRTETKRAIERSLRVVAIREDRELRKPQEFGYLAPDPYSTLESVSTFPTLALPSFDLQAGAATVLTYGGSDPSDLSAEVTVHFQNTPIPEPGTAWLLGLGLTVWALRGKPAMRPYLASLRNATNSVMRRA
jgi:hypothetical protein